MCAIVDLCFWDSVYQVYRVHCSLWWLLRNWNFYFIHIFFLFVFSFSLKTTSMMQSIVGDFTVWAPAPLNRRTASAAQVQTTPTTNTEPMNIFILEKSSNQQRDLTSFPSPLFKCWFPTMWPHQLRRGVTLRPIRSFSFSRNFLTETGFNVYCFYLF